MIKEIKNGLIFGITAGFSMLLIVATYAAWTSLGTVSNNQPLTADFMNDVINNINFNNNNVAFNLKLNSHKTYIPGDKVIWDTATLNEGNYYNLSTNKFIAPYDGVYEFNIAIGPFDLTSSQMRLRVNGVGLAYGIVHHTNSYTSSSKNIIIELSSGDEVETYYEGYSSSSGKLDYLLSTFNGKLLFKK